MPHRILQVRRARGLAAMFVVGLAATLPLVALQAVAQTAQPAPAPTATPSSGQALPAATLRLLRSHQVWRDEMPDQVEASDVEVVFLSPDSRCRPPTLPGLFGTRIDTLPPVTGALCRRIESFAKAPPPSVPMALRVHTGAVAARSPAQVLAAIEPAPTRRYVALVHWDWAQPQRDIAWFFEVAVVDRSSGRWVWHGARAHPVWPGREWQEQTEVNALRALLVHELPRDLLTRLWWQEDLPVPGSRWVPVQDIAAYLPAAGRAGLAIVNSYYSSDRLSDIAALKLWPVGTAQVDDTESLRQGDRSQGSTVRRAQSTPLLAPDTHMLLDLPAGDYDMRVYTSVEPLRLEAGRITVLNITRALGNAKVASKESEAWWRQKVLGERGRHAFLAEPPARGFPAVVPYFLEAAP